MVKVLPVASSGIDLDTSADIEIQYVPKIYHKLSLYKTIEGLLEKTDTTSGGKSSKELQVIRDKIKRIEELLASINVLHKASDFATYDPIYGVNRKKITQDFNKNIMIGTYGW